MVAAARPRYETEANKKREKACVKKLNGAWRRRLRKLPFSYHLDYALVQGEKVIVWLEIKGRSHSFATYDTLILSMLKWRTGIEWFRATGCPFVVVAALTDGNFYYVFREEDAYSFDITYTGRTKQTRDEADIEPVVHIPMDCFHPVVDGGLPDEMNPTCAGT
jgi:hypothetical protein